jgi:hypothetical protein
MSTAESKAVVRREFEEALNQHNLAIIDEITAPDYTDRAEPPFPVALINEPARPTKGPAVLRATVEWLLAAFPDLHFTINLLIAEQDLVAVFSTLEATHRGTFMGVPPSGKKIRTTRTDIFRVKDGQLTEHWANRDDLGMFIQLGLIQPPRR